MKRIKIMLMSIALVAVVGGALAFKAKYDADFCTAAPIWSTCPVQACPNPEFASNIDPASPLDFVCTTEKPHGIACNNGIQCTTEYPVKLTTGNMRMLK